MSMPTVWKLLSVVLVGAMLAPVRAGIQTPCNDPTVLSGPKVHVFILPYQAESKLTQRGRELATIVQRHVLFAALKYQSIAVAELTGEAQECRYEKLAQSVYSRLKNGQAAIFLWGRVFEQGDAIRLQSTVAFSMVGSTDRYEWTLDRDSGAKTQATVPADPVIFSPRVIPLNFLQMLEPAQREARRLHASPDSASPAMELPNDPDARFGFEVMETRNDWMHVRLFPSRDTGWIPAHALTDGSNLKGTFPELYFVDALIGYHQLWGTPNRTAVGDPRRTLTATRRSFDEYLNQAASRAESDARALAAILKGNATLRASGSADAWSTDALQEAEKDYQNAQRQAPASTVANNFSLACASALCTRGVCGEGANRLHAQYLDAIARDPTSKELITNLNAFYEVAEKGRIAIGIPPDQLAQQRTVAKRLQETMR
jgi:hypothetical protein